MSLIGLARRALKLGRGVTLGLSDDALNRDPFKLFGEWFDDAHEASLMEPTAMTLATCGKDGRPSARMVLLKSFDHDGFVFYTNYGSRKAAEMAENPQVALVLYWQPLLRQVRIEGTVEKIGQQASTPYFNSRARGSRVGAWASRQSEVLDKRANLEERVAHYQQKFTDGEVPLPEFWGGYRVRPEMIEFWQGRASRLHDRARFLRDGADWTANWLYP
jgi:pyridoxamine 5'-phosphate oxidase